MSGVGAGAAASGAPRERRLGLLLLAVLVPCYAVGLGSDTLVHGDEAYWIQAGTRAVSRVLAGDLTSSAWQVGSSASVLEAHHPVETAANRNPRLGAMLIGLPIVLLDAPRPEVWHRDYAFGRTPEWNRRRGLLPERATLRAARIPVAALAVVSALWFFQLMRTLVHPTIAFAGALLLASDPLVQTLCRRAMLDGPAYAFSIGAVLAAARACAAPRGVWPWCATGLLAGAAVSSKLNAGILFPVLAAAFGVEALLRRSGAVVVRACAAAALACAIFVATNPTLYVATLDGIRSMLRLGSEIQGLGGPFREMALPDAGSRIAAAHEILLVENGLLGAPFGLPLDTPLLLLGSCVLALHARQSAARVVLLWAVVALVAVCTWPPVRWDRYFLPALAPIAAAEVVALGIVVPALLRRHREAARS